MTELADRIALERKVLGLKPWELAPSEVDDGPSPWPPGTAGYESWGKAQEMRERLDELLKKAENE